MNTQRMAIIGAGNMARALIGGLQAGIVASSEQRAADRSAAWNIVVADPADEQLQRVRTEFTVETTTDNLQAVRDAQLIILAIKPQVMAEVAAHLRPALGNTAIVISVAAGVRLASLVQWLGGHTHIIRAMPNRPAVFQRGISALFAGPAVDARTRATVTQVMQAMGQVVWLEHEAQMDAVTAISGSGPAYFFLLMEALESAARDLGLPADIARTLSVETAYGAGYMAHYLQNDKTQPAAGDPATMRADVTSPGGTTAAALQVLAQCDFNGIVLRAVRAACARSAALAQTAGSGQNTAPAKN